MTSRGIVPIPVDTVVPLTVLITSAWRGIGYELARQYAEANKENRVIAGVRDVSLPQMATLVATYPNVTVLQLDTENEESVYASVEQVEKITGGSLDVLIPNACILSARDDLSHSTLSDLTSMLDRKVTACLCVVQEYLHLLRASTRLGRPSRVVFISSPLGVGDAASAPVLGEFGEHGEHACVGTRVSNVGIAVQRALHYLNSAFAFSARDVIFVAASLGWTRNDVVETSPANDARDAAQGLRALIETRTEEHTGQFVDNVMFDDVEHMTPGY